MKLQRDPTIPPLLAQKIRNKFKHTIYIYVQRGPSVPPLLAQKKCRCIWSKIVRLVRYLVFNIWNSRIRSVFTPPSSKLAGIKFYTIGTFPESFIEIRQESDVLHTFKVSY